MKLNLYFLQLFNISEMVMVLKSPDEMPGLILFLSASLLLVQMLALLIYHVRIL